MIALLVIFFSCCSGNNGQNATTAKDGSQPVASASAYDASLTKGMVIDSVICRANTAVSYALYLPSYYSSDKKFPCIYFFDAHARGPLPVGTYKEIAEKYGFILVGSNVSKNGTRWEVTNDGVKAMLADSRTRINIDPARMYTAGFSGGSRVASSVAIMDGDIAGVIGCAAGFPSINVEPQNKFDYFGLVGEYDFNYTEMLQLDGALEQNGFAHQLLTFEGIHGWPSSNDFQTAILWMQVYSIKKKLQSPNDSIITAFKGDFDKRILDAKSGNERIKTQELLSGIVRALDGLSDISNYKSQLTALVNSTDYKNAIALQAKLQQEEANGQQELAKQFTMYDAKWWAKKIGGIKQNIDKAKTQQESQMHKRLLNYLGLVGYMNASHALNTGDLAHALTYLSIFRMADPKNPDCDYLTAVYYAKSGNPEAALSSLTDAVVKGYAEKAQLANDPALRGIQEYPRFKMLFQKWNQVPGK